MGMCDVEVLLRLEPGQLARSSGLLTKEIIMKRYWQFRKLHLLSAEEVRNLRLSILFGDDLTGKLVLPETSVYSAEATDDTCYHLGAVTKPITKELPEISKLS